MKQIRIEYLLNKLVDRSLTGEERTELQLLLENPEHVEAFATAAEKIDIQPSAIQPYQSTLDAVLQQILAFDRLEPVPAASNPQLPVPTASHPPLVVHRARSLYRLWAAASIILALGIGAYLWTTKNISTTETAKVNIAPGGEGAILTLADGTQIILDNISNGIIAQQGGATAKVVNGALQYEGKGKDVVYNTMHTPKGRQFSLLLPDGTKVWLNAASSIRYPVVFEGKERKVQLIGEGYFEVMKNAKMPFRVNVNDKAEVEVLGTHFNVNAYENENAISTTLLEGSVSVASSTTGFPGNNAQETLSDQLVMLRPGQQAQINQVDQKKQPGIKVLNNTDLEKVIAWKNGSFNFEDTNLKEAMRQLERWYDIELVYEKDVPDIVLTGEMTRGVTLNDLIEGLKKIGVKVRLEGRKLIIMP